MKFCVEVLWCIRYFDNLNCLHLAHSKCDRQTNGRTDRKVAFGNSALSQLYAMRKNLPIISISD